MPCKCFDILFDFSNFDSSDDQTYLCVHSTTSHSTKCVDVQLTLHFEMPIHIFAGNFLAQSFL